MVFIFPYKYLPTFKFISINDLFEIILIFTLFYKAIYTVCIVEEYSNVILSFIAQIEINKRSKNL